MNSERINLVASKIALGIADLRDLPGVAMQALEDGLDSPSMCLLAGLASSEIENAKPLFESALKELKIQMPPKRDALIRLVKETALEINRGVLSPCEGSRRIWEFVLLLPFDRFPELDTFVYAASEWDERPEDRKLLEDGIKSAAKELAKSNWNLRN